MSRKLIIVLTSYSSHHFHICLARLSVSNLNGRRQKVTITINNIAWVNNEERKDEMVWPWTSGGERWVIMITMSFYNKLWDQDNPWDNIIIKSSDHRIHPKWNWIAKYEAWLSNKSWNHIKKNLTKFPKFTKNAAFYFNLI